MQFRVLVEFKNDHRNLQRGLTEALLSLSVSNRGARNEKTTPSVSNRGARNEKTTLSVSKRGARNDKTIQFVVDVI
jgi:hypothetical protein